MSKVVAKKQSAQSLVASEFLSNVGKPLSAYELMAKFKVADIHRMIRSLCSKGYRIACQRNKSTFNNYYQEKMVKYGLQNIPEGHYVLLSMKVDDGRGGRVAMLHDDMKKEVINRDPSCIRDAHGRVIQSRYFLVHTIHQHVTRLLSNGKSWEEISKHYEAEIDQPVSAKALQKYWNAYRSH